MTDHSHLAADHSRRADAIVIFGVTGDLVAKKLFPALHALALNDRLNVPVIGVGRSGWTDTALRAAARASLPTTDREGAAAFQSLSTRLRMVSGDYADHRTYEDISEQLAGAQQPVFYLATPPSLSPVIAEGLRKSGLADTARVVIEKPFGRDLESAVMLERRLRDTFADENIFRVDHYLAKEPVEGLQILRFDNELFEPIWNRNHIAAVEVTLAEELGTEHRPGFYDEAGAIRDVLQNHVLQIVALLAMERPVDDTADAFHEAQARLLRQIRPLSSTDTLRGQYDGYRDQVGVASNSTTETFVAAQLCIDSDRWAGVPFRVRAGKRMAQTATEAVVIFKRPSRLTSVQPAGALADPDVVRLRLGSDDGVTISLQAKAPGRGPVSRPVNLSVDFTEALGRRQDAYERLLDDVMDGTGRRFARWDTIAEQWRIVAHVLDLADTPTRYQPGSWGPDGHRQLGTAAWHPLDLAAGANRGLRRSPASGHAVDIVDQRLAG